jgi:predicted nucleic acid-binding protein
MGTVVLDASVLIGFLDRSDALHIPSVVALQRWLVAGNTRLAPASVYAEAMEFPMREARGVEIDRFLAETRIDVVPIDREMARLAAEARAAESALRLADAFVVAAARVHGGEVLTHDLRLRRIAARLLSR